MLSSKFNRKVPQRHKSIQQQTFHKIRTHFHRNKLRLKNLQCMAPKQANKVQSPKSLRFRPYQLAKRVVPLTRVRKCPQITVVLVLNYRRKNRSSTQLQVNRKDNRNWLLNQMNNTMISKSSIKLWIWNKSKKKPSRPIQVEKNQMKKIKFQIMLWTLKNIRLPSWTQMTKMMYLNKWKMPK